MSTFIGKEEDSKKNKDEMNNNNNNNTIIVIIITIIIIIITIITIIKQQQQQPVQFENWLLTIGISSHNYSHFSQQQQQQLLERWREQQRQQPPQQQQQQKFQILHPEKLLLSLFEEHPLLNPLPHPYLFYKKTYKTGSSTLQSILQRLSINYQLRAPVTEKREWLIDESWRTEGLGTKNPLLKVLTTEGKDGRLGPPFDIWFYHVFIGKLPLVQEIVPNATAIVTSFRDPATRAASAIKYFSRSQPSVKKLRQSPGNSLWGRDSVIRQLLGRKTQDWHVSEEEYQHLEQDLKDGKYFVVILERLQESLAAFSLVYNLHPFDVISSHIKHNRHKKKEIYDPDNYLKEYLQYEYKFYDASIEWLDNLIATFPQQVFEERLKVIDEFSVAFSQVCRQGLFVPLPYPYYNVKLQCKLFRNDNPAWQDMMKRCLQKQLLATDECGRTGFHNITT